jgi:energy-coupling factor transporter transmembrane protein EcfT
VRWPRKATVIMWLAPVVCLVGGKALTRVGFNTITTVITMISGIVIGVVGLAKSRGRILSWGYVTSMALSLVCLVAPSVWPPPTSTTSTSTDIITQMDCSPREQWDYTFPPNYQGGVYVHLVASSPSKGMVTLGWGGVGWQENGVEIFPGSVQQHKGGTVLEFTKLKKDDNGSSTPVYVTSAIPVCAAFGTFNVTTDTDLPHGSKRINANSGWK